MGSRSRRAGDFMLNRPTVFPTFLMLEWSCAFSLRLPPDSAMSRLLLASIVILALFDVGLVVFGVVTGQFSIAAMGGGLLAVLGLLYVTLRRADRGSGDGDT
jgi:hypothetical protein